MKKEDLFRALGEIDEEWIDEALEEKKIIRRWNWMPSAAAAAIAILVIGGSGGYLLRKTSPGETADLDTHVSQREMVYEEADVKSSEQRQEEKWETATENGFAEEPVVVIPIDAMEAGEVYEEAVPAMAEELDVPSLTSENREMQEEALEIGAPLQEQEYWGEETEIMKTEPGVSLETEEEPSLTLEEDASLSASKENEKMLKTDLQEAPSVTQGFSILFQMQNYSFTGKIAQEEPGNFLEEVELEIQGENYFCKVYGNKIQDGEIAVEIKGQYYIFQVLYPEEVEDKTE